MLRCLKDCRALRTQQRKLWLSSKDHRAEREARDQASWKTGIHSSREPRGKQEGSLCWNKTSAGLLPVPRTLGVEAKNRPSRTALLALRCAPGAPSLWLRSALTCGEEPEALRGWWAPKRSPPAGPGPTFGVLRVQPPNPAHQQKRSRNRWHTPGEAQDCLSPASPLAPQAQPFFPHSPVSLRFSGCFSYLTIWRLLAWCLHNLQS